MQRPTFPDVPRGHWAATAIEIQAGAGIFEGRPDGSFGGAQPVRRGEMAVVMARLLNRFPKLLALTPAAKTPAFPDVPPRHWSRAALDEAARFGLLGGRADGTVGVGEPLSRYDVALATSRL